MINSINNNQEVVVTHHTEIEAVFREHFQHIFYSSNPFTNDTMKSVQFV